MREQHGEMASFSVYILQSETSGRFYCGHTNDLSRRIRQHNDPEYTGSKTTKKFAGLWVLVWSRSAASRSAAMNLERRIKKRGVKRFLTDADSVAKQAESRLRRD